MTSLEALTQVAESFQQNVKPVPLSIASRAAAARLKPAGKGWESWGFELGQIVSPHFFSISLLVDRRGYAVAELRHLLSSAAPAGWVLAAHCRAILYYE